MTVDTWNLLTSGGAALDLTPGARLKFTGPDAERYLNGQVTNDVRRLRPGEAMPACVTNHKGKLEAFVWLSREEGGALFVSADAELRDFLPLRLEKYLIADDAAMEDVTDATALVHFCGVAEASALPEPLPGERMDHAARLGLPGIDVWTTPERLDFWKSQRLLLTPEDAADLRVLHGVPAWGRELTPDVLPPEARLEEVAIDYYKGCYIGQEVISRMRTAGKVNRSLERLEVVEGGEPSPDWTLFLRKTPGGPAETAGRFTGVARHPATGAWHALGYVKRAAAGEEGEFFAGPDENSLPVRLKIRKTPA